MVNGLLNRKVFKSGDHIENIKLNCEVIGLL